MTARPTPQAYLSWTPSGAAAQTLVFDAVVSETWSLGATITEHPVEVGANVADNVRVSLAQVTLEVFVTNEPVGPSQWASPALVSQPLTVKQAGWTLGTGVVTVRRWDSELAARVAATSAGGAVGGLVGGAAGGSSGGSIGGIVGAVAGVLVGQDLLGPHEEDVSVQTSAGLVPPAGATEDTDQAPGFQPRQVATASLIAQTLAFTDVDDFVARTIAQLEALRDSAQLIDVIGSKLARQNMVIEQFDAKRDADTTGAAITLGLREVRIVQTALVAAPKPTIPRGAPPTKKGPQNPTEAPPAISSTLAVMAGNILSPGQKAVSSITGLPLQ